MYLFICVCNLCFVFLYLCISVKSDELVQGVRYCLRICVSVFVYLCNCVFLYLCICVFVYLSNDLCQADGCSKVLT